LVNWSLNDGIGAQALLSEHLPLEFGLTKDRHERFGQQRVFAD
jgi:hypothetical protein